VLDARSEVLARDLLDGLSPGQRERLDATLAEAERLLRAGSVRVEDSAARRPRGGGRRCAATSRSWMRASPVASDPGDAATFRRRGDVGTPG